VVRTETLLIRLTNAIASITSNRAPLTVDFHLTQSERPSRPRRRR
jgi:hypothetical protein